MKTRERTLGILKKNLEGKQQKVLEKITCKDEELKAQR